MGFSVAACSGVFAALASVISKIALEDGGILIRAAICPWIQDEYCDTASIQILNPIIDRYILSMIQYFNCV